MSMIEVDTTLFVTCRLCLDEMGHYQIVPQVKTQIKYCFDIEVELFDGLPQLICKKCESILSQYAEMKQKFQEKQCRLKANIKEGHKSFTASSFNQQQDTVSSTQQVDSDSKNTRSTTKPKNNKTLVSTTRKLVGVKKNVGHQSRSAWKNDYLKNFVCRLCSKSLKNKKSIVHHLKQCHLLRNYSSILRNCFIKITKIDSKPNFTFSNENVVHGKDKIINSDLENYYVLYTRKYNENCTSPSSDSSDEDFTAPRKKYKRLRLLSKSSTETLVLGDNNMSQSFDTIEDKQNDTTSKENELTDVSDVELINVDDSDSASTTSTLRNIMNKPDTIADETRPITTAENDKVIQNVIMMSYNKYLKRLDMNARNSKDTGNSESFLQRKILSIGRKVVNNKGLHSTGLIRYMEHKDLDVLWIPKNQTNVFIRTTLKDNLNSESNQFNWKCLKDVDKTYESNDFVDIFEKNNRSRNVEYQYSATIDITEGENNVTPNLNNSLDLNKQSHYDICNEGANNSVSVILPLDRRVENSVLFIRTSEAEKQSIWTKILNANPVANPKQLPKKSTSTELFTLLTKPPSTSSNSDTLPNNVANFENDANYTTLERHMPIITSTVSLAQNTNDKDKSKESNNETVNTLELGGAKSPLPLPRIKVKPVAELMPDKTAQKTVLVPSNATSIYNNDNNMLGQNKNSSMVFLINSETSNTNVNFLFPKPNSYSQCNINPNSGSLLFPMSNGTLRNIQDQEFLIMHTVELPHTKTKSPFRYLQQLLQIHNIVLLDSIEIITVRMSCLIKFKIMFHQEASVTLCLAFFCKDNKFLIRITDINSRHLDIARLSAYWQWQILKEFNGNIVSKIHENANKIGAEVLRQTSYFIRYISSIEVTFDESV